MLKRYERLSLVALLGLTAAALVMGFFGNPAKWVATAGLLGTVSGVVQLEVSGFFKAIMEAYSDPEKAPLGPPSFITRELIDNPDAPVRTWIRNKSFFDVRTGFGLIVVGTLTQVLAVWL